MFLTINDKRLSTSFSANIIEQQEYPGKSDSLSWLFYMICSDDLCSINVSRENNDTIDLYRKIVRSAIIGR